MESWLIEKYYSPSCYGLFKIKMPSTNLINKLVPLSCVSFLSPTLTLIVLLSQPTVMHFQLNRSGCLFEIRKRLILFLFFLNGALIHMSRHTGPSRDPRLCETPSLNKSGRKEWWGERGKGTNYFKTKNIISNSRILVHSSSRLLEWEFQKFRDYFGQKPEVLRNNSKQLLLPLPSFQL